MPRRKPRPAPGPPARPLRANQSVETGADGDWTVRRLSGAASGKVYRCPGCQQEIPAAVAHVVAWPAHTDGADRRHWHTACWTARDRRRPRGLPT